MSQLFPNCVPTVNTASNLVCLIKCAQVCQHPDSLRAPTRRQKEAHRHNEQLVAPLRKCYSIAMQRKWDHPTRIIRNASDGVSHPIRIVRSHLMVLGTGAENGPWQTPDLPADVALDFNRAHRKTRTRSGGMRFGVCHRHVLAERYNSAAYTFTQAPVTKTVPSRPPTFSERSPGNRYTILQSTGLAS